MSTILFAWELGSGFGHVRPLLSIARGLASLGHTPVFAIRNIPDTWTLLRESGFAVYQAPFRNGAPRLAPGPFAGRSFEDVLSISGWSDPDELEPLLRAWDALLDSIRPSLVVLDHAPALALAARGSIPVVQIGTGFCLPPSHLPEFLAVRPSAKALVPREALLSSIAEVQRRRGRPPLSTLPSLFDASLSFPTSFPEFDPHASLRKEAHVGPLEPVPDPVPLPASPFWFAYLGADVQGIDSILRDLSRAGIPGRVFVRGLDGPGRARLRGAGVNVLESPLPLAEILAGSSVIVHHGGAGLLASALAAGRPQMLFPLWLEQELPAKRLEEAGVALVADADIAPRKTLIRLATEPAFAEAAARAAARIHAAGPWRGCEVVVERCRSLLEKGGGA